MGILTQYIQAAMREAIFEKLVDGDLWYASIPCCRGVWATEKTMKKCEDTLQEVLEEWLLLKLRDNDPLEKIGGVTL